jgi:hypothetical protein
MPSSSARGVPGSPLASSHPGSPNGVPSLPTARRGCRAALLLAPAPCGPPRGGLRRQAAFPGRAGPGLVSRAPPDRPVAAGGWVQLRSRPVWSAVQVGAGAGTRARPWFPIAHSRAAGGQKPAGGGQRIGLGGLGTAGRPLPRLLWRGTWGDKNCNLTGN